MCSPICQRPKAALTPTFLFSDGVLAIGTPLSQMRLRWHPEPLAEQMTPGQTRWKPFAPEFRLVTQNTSSASGSSPAHVGEPIDSPAANAKAAAFAAFQTTIPPLIVQAVGRFQSHQWLVMLLLHRQPAVLDLVEINPALAYCLANNDQFRGTRDSVSLLLALGHSRQKQRTLLQWLGFPGSESMARAFRRIPPETVSPARLRRLRYAIEADANIVDRLAHMPCLNAGVLDLTIGYHLQPLLTTRLLLAVSRRAEELCLGLTAGQLEGALALRREMGAALPQRPLTTIQQIARLQEQTDIDYRAFQHQQLATQDAEQHRRHQAAPRRRRAHTRKKVPPYPAPPIPGTPDIVPITSQAELVQEGQVQDHCVASYLPSVRDGLCYIYRVTAPERATLSIVPSSDGGWRRSELKGLRNSNVQPLTIQSVDRWLSQHRLSVAGG